MSSSLFVELMGQFYGHGWMLGSSGGMASFLPSPNHDQILMSPSSVPKERLSTSDLFIYDAHKIQNGGCPNDNSLLECQPLHGPSHLRPSACTPLFLLLLQSSPGSQCVIHTHSKAANLGRYINR
jgi:ribulose-5-phosphate 4-epimerase/fuculose-1-phosphate aldolase